MSNLRFDRIAFMTDSGVSTRIGVIGIGAESLVWSSAEPDIASVTPDGTVTAHRAGETVITAAAADETMLTCRVTVDRAGQNPIVPSTWGLFIADGEPHIFDGNIYVYGSRDIPNAWNGDRYEWCSEDYHVIRSDDMIHWTDTGVSLRLDDIPEDIRGDAGRLWAPDCFRDPLTGKYYLLFCTDRGGIIISESTKPEGPFVNHRALTMNGERFHVIDPGVLVDGDKVYMVLPTFAVMQLDPEDYSRVLPETFTPVTQWMDPDNDPFEGPSIRKYGDLYYYIYIKNYGHVADNGPIPTYMGYMTAPSPLGPYTDRGLLADSYEYPNAGNIHGSLCEWKGAYYLFHHLPIMDLAMTRTMAIQPIIRRPDGTFEQAVLTSSGFRGAFQPGDIIEAGSFCAISGGRLQTKRRYFSRTLSDPKDERFITAITDHPYIVFCDIGNGVTYRYMDFPGVPMNVTMRVRTQSEGSILSMKADGEFFAEIRLPDTEDEWRTVTCRADAVNGRKTVDIVLSAAGKTGDAALESFSFTAAE